MLVNKCKCLKEKIYNFPKLKLVILCVFVSCVVLDAFIGVNIEIALKQIENIFPNGVKFIRNRNMTKYIEMISKMYKSA